MTVILAFCLYIAGFCLISGWILTKAAIPGSQAIVFAVLFFLYSCIAGGLALLVYLWGDPRLVLYIFCLFIALAAIGSMFVSLSRIRHGIRIKDAVLFVLYVLAILTVALFTRRSRTETVLQLELFAAVKSTLMEGSLEELNHMILNVVMFIPLGYLFVQMHPNGLGKVAQVVGISVLLSTFIEICQLIFRLGNCDVDDILANTTGAFLGLLVFRIIHRRKE